MDSPLRRITSEDGHKHNREHFLTMPRNQLHLALKTITDGGFLAHLRDSTSGPYRHKVGEDEPVEKETTVQCEHDWSITRAS